MVELLLNVLWHAEWDAALTEVIRSQPVSAVLLTTGDTIRCYGVTIKLE